MTRTYDGDIDYSRYTALELREALAGIRRDVYPRNYANILAALSALDAAAAASMEVRDTALDSGESDVSDLLASRGSRVVAILIDAAIAMAALLPIDYALGYWQLVRDALETQQPIPYGAMLQYQAIALVFFVLVQGYPLVKDGQTWGKKAMDIRIVDLQDRKPSLARLALRYGFTNVIGGIPILGRWVMVIDDLSIFRDDRRCIHDLIAGTRVIRVAAGA